MPPPRADTYAGSETITDIVESPAGAAGGGTVEPKQKGKFFGGLKALKSKSTSGPLKGPATASSAPPPPPPPSVRTK